MIVLGISGPTASGKGLTIKTMRRLFPRAHVFSADQAAHRAYQKGTPLYRKLISHFGVGVLKKSGSINRKKMGDIVFRDPGALQYLNRHTHPKIRQALKDRIAKAAGRGIPLFIVDAALLHTIPLHSFVHESWVIQAKESIRVSRLVRNRGMTPREARARIRSQKRIPFQCPKDRILTNNGTKGEFIQKVRMAYNDLLRHGAST